MKGRNKDRNKFFEKQPQARRRMILVVECKCFWPAIFGFIYIEIVCEIYYYNDIFHYYLLWVKSA